MTDLPEDYQTPEEWNDYGDANPDRHGGLWLRWDSGEWDVVETIPAADVDPGVPDESADQYVKDSGVQPEDLFVDGDPTEGFTERAERVIDAMSQWDYLEPVGFVVDGHLGGLVAEFARRYWSGRTQREHLDDWGDYWDMIESYGVEYDEDDYPRE